MDLWFSALLGLVQGLTEFIPISSTAHLRIVPALLGRPDPGAAYTAVLQLGTLVAVVAYFRSDLLRMARAALVDRRSPDGRLFAHVVLGTVPIVVAGLALKPLVENEFRSLIIVASALIAVAVVMGVADRTCRNDRGIGDMTWRDALLIGGAQALALVPGVSRSGATITMALFVGLARPECARFSFLLSIPAIAGAGLFELPRAVSALGSDAAPALVAGSAVAAVSGYASIAWLLRFLRTRTLLPFAAYRVALGVLLLALVAYGALRP